MMLYPPKTMSEIAKELWEEQKQDFGYPDEMRMAFIIGANYGLARMQNMCHPMVVDDGVVDHD